MSFSKVLAVFTVAACVACSAPRPSAPPAPVAPAAPPSSPAIEAEYEAACEGVPAEDRLSCPIIKWSRSLDDVDGGVVLHLGQYAPPPEQTAKRARCHRAWMARNNRSMPGPLSTSGAITIAAAAGSEGTDVTITAADSATVDEVRARSHKSFDREHRR